MIWIATALCTLAAAAGDDDAGRKLTAEAFPHSIHRTVIPNESSSGFLKHVQYWIGIGETDQDFRLGRFYEDKYDGLGYNEKSLEIEWLDPGRALWLHWKTVNQGTGHYIAQGNVVLVKSENRWTEIFRDCRASYSRGHGGISSHHGIRMRFQWDRARNALHVTEAAYWSEWSKTPRPLARPSGSGDAGVAYGCEYTFIREWVGVLTGDSLVFGDGKEFLSLEHDDASFPVKEFATFLSGHDERPDALATLLRLNPGLTGDSPAPEPFLVADPIPPFEPWPDDIYHTGI